MALFNAVQFFSYGQATESMGEGRLTIPQYFKAGLIAGFAVSFVEAPMDLFKSQMQTAVFSAKNGTATTYNGVADCVAKIYKAGGVRGVFQGLGPTIVRDVPAVSLYFGMYEWTREQFAKNTGKAVDKLEAWQLLAAGGVGGFSYWISTYPIDVIKSSMQVRYNHFEIF
jgi:solute carrier family 25 carnitine/acylcarnitine transporter 20/29